MLVKEEMPANEGQGLRVYAFYELSNTLRGSRRLQRYYLTVQES